MATNDNATMTLSSGSVHKTPQRTLILQWMQEGRTITALEALREFGCFRLASRIADLRKRGHNIAREMFIDPVSHKRYARYSLVTEDAKTQETPSKGKSVFGIIKSLFSTKDASRGDRR